MTKTQRATESASLPRSRAGGTYRPPTRGAGRCWELESVIGSCERRAVALDSILGDPPGGWSRPGDPLAGSGLLLGPAAPAASREDRPRMRDPARSDEPFGPLRRDVRLLGSLLGTVLVEQEGEAFLAAEERVRAAARRSREIGDPGIVRDAVRALPPDDQGRVLRAFAIYFQLANTAEQHHRLRRRREYSHQARPARESLAEA